MVGDYCSFPGDKTDMHSQRNPKNGLSCKMVLQAVGKVLRYVQHLFYISVHILTLGI